MDSGRGQGKRVVILGSTGSIGESALKVARELGPEQMQVVGLAAGTRHEQLAAQAKEFGVTDVCIYCLLYTSPSPRDKRQSRMPSSA